MVKRKLLLSICALFIILQLAGCGNNLAPVSSSISTQSQSESLALNETSSAIPSDSIVANYMGAGNIEYSVLSIQTASSWSEVGVNENDVLDLESSQGKDAIVLVTLNIQNIDIPTEPQNGIDPADINIGCITLMSNEAITAAENGPMAIIDTIYFDQAPKSDSDPEHINYYHYSLPEIGNSKEVKLGWSVSQSVIEESGLSLVHTFGDINDSVIMPLNL